MVENKVAGIPVAFQKNENISSDLFWVWSRRGASQKPFLKDERDKRQFRGNIPHVLRKECHWCSSPPPPPVQLASPRGEKSLWSS